MSSRWSRPADGTAPGPNRGLQVTTTRRPGSPALGPPLPGTRRSGGGADESEGRAWRQAWVENICSPHSTLL